jgi:NADH:quinone reductase (non-electrogenic)
VLWTVGVAAPPIAEALAKATRAERDRAGRIVVGDDLTIPGHAEIFVVGDLMRLRKLPGVAEVAIQSGVYAGRRIKAQVTGRGAEKPFRYRSLGTAAYISRGRALLSLGPLHLRGFPGWLGWLFFHIAFLTTGFRNRVGAILTWLLALARDDRRERSFISHQAGRLRDIYPSLAGDTAGSAAGRSPATGRDVSQAPGRGGPGPSGAR